MNMTTSDEANGFTDRELQIIFGTLRGLSNVEIGQQHGIGEDVVVTSRASVYDKLGLSNRLDLFEFVKAALNSELRCRLGDSPR
jgi:DNA-binding CsgD family transcriptional regulator